jgi:hypothetical protein
MKEMVIHMNKDIFILEFLVGNPERYLTERGIKALKQVKSILDAFNSGDKEMFDKLLTELALELREDWTEESITEMLNDESFIEAFYAQKKSENESDKIMKEWHEK